MSEKDLTPYAKPLKELIEGLSGLAQVGATVKVALEDGFQLDDIKKIVAEGLDERADITEAYKVIDIVDDELKRLASDPIGNMAEILELIGVAKVEYNAIMIVLKG